MQTFEAEGMWKRGVIPYTPFPRSTTLKWFPADTEEQYRTHGNHDYSPDDITYEFNSYGYRSIEPDPDTPNRKIMFAGCSLTQGVGLPHHEMWTTVATQALQDHYGFEIEQHNFGVGGFGNDTHAMNVFQVAPILKPDVVVVLFSETSRLTYFHELNRCANLGAHWRNAAVSEGVYKGFLRMQSDTHDYYRWVNSYNIIDMSLKLLGIPWFGIWTTPVPDHAWDFVEQDKIMVATCDKPSALFLPNDLARDGMHPGALGNFRLGWGVADRIKQMKVF